MISSCSLNVSTNFQDHWTCFSDSKSDLLSNRSKSVQLMIECETNFKVQGKSTKCLNSGRKPMKIGSKPKKEDLCFI